MTSPRPYHRPLLILTLLFVLLARASAVIKWAACTSKADYKPVEYGDFYDLCIDDHEFEGESFAWRLTKAEIKNTVFDNCRFETNKAVKTNKGKTETRQTNFTGATWNAVTFKNSIFGSGHRGRNIVFEQTKMDNVKFENCTFHHSIDLVFDRFEAFNLTFENCRFEGNTVFTMGQMSSMYMIDSVVRRSKFSSVASGDDAFLFKGMTMYGVTIRDSKFINPIRFESVNAAEVEVEKTDFNEFWCHSEPKNGEIERRAQFNESIFQKVNFLEKVYCDQTAWTDFTMGNSTFRHDADFSDSKILAINWDNVVHGSSTGDCRELDFSKTEIERNVFANVTVECQANFEETTFQTLLIRNFYGRRANFNNAIFVMQEFIDRQCCSTVCVPLKCKCNVTEPSGNCPIGGPDVNVSAVTPVCFPGDASLQRYNEEASTYQPVSMAELSYNERVAVGNGEHSNVYFFGHRAPQAKAEYVAIRHATSRKAVRLSANHYLYVNGRLRTAAGVRPGDRLRAADGQDSLFVTEVSREQGVGVYAPTSLHGDLLVDGVVVSSYTAAVHPRLAHRLLMPVRGLYYAGLHGVVRRLTMLHERSYVGLARALGLPMGPEFVH